MSDKRVVITGLGVLSSNAIGKEAFFEAVSKGISGIKPVSLFDTAQFEIKTAGEIKDFAPEEFLGPKGLRTLDRSTKLVSSAAKLALDDAKFTVDEANSCDAGVAIGTTLGSLRSICDFDRDAIQDGPRYVNPALFPNTVINSPASQVSIRFNIKGFNATISTGFCASLDAVNYAADFIRLGRAKAVLAGGVEELCIQTFLGFYRTSLMACASTKGGVTVGEGSAVFMLEELGSARERSAHIYAEILGYGSGYGSQDGIKKAMEQAVKESGLSAADIDRISLAANLDNENDIAETQAVKELFGGNVRTDSVKPLVGECYSASGSLQMAAAVGLIEKQQARNILINAFGPKGPNSSLVISKFRG